MNVKTTIGKLLPNSLKSALRSNYLVKRNLRRMERKNLDALGAMTCDTSTLKTVESSVLTEIFASNDMHSSWIEAKKKIDSFEIPDLTGGVNPGDRRTLYYLLRYFKPNAVLEIGTHIGASTLHLAAALHKNREEGSEPVYLKTLDIRDINSTIHKPWLEFGTGKSPLEMITSLKFKEFVNFEVDTSLNYLRNSNEKFDFIFLDGDHSASTVYQEIPLALDRLNENGVILLHDYFPNGKPLWSNNSVAPGPYMATERHLEEGKKMRIVPIGALPWPTKLNSNYTSLALLLGSK